MQTVMLDEKEWQQVMGLMSLGPWRDANPLLMKIGQQLQAQAQHQQDQPQQAPKIPGAGPNGPSKEVRS